MSELEPKSKKHSPKKQGEGLAEEILKKLKTTKEAKTMEAKRVEFPELEEGRKGARLEGKLLGNIPVGVAVELGRTEMTLREVLELAEGSIIELDRLAGEPLDLKVGDQLIAQGEVIAVDDYYGLRITHVAIKPC